MTAQDIVDHLLDMELDESRIADWVSDTTEFVKDKLGFGMDSFGLKKNTEKGWKPNYSVQPHKKYRAVRRDLPQPPREAKPARQTTWQDE